MQLSFGLAAAAFHPIPVIVGARALRTGTRGQRWFWIAVTTSAVFDIIVTFFSSQGWLTGKVSYLSEVVITLLFLEAAGRLSDTPRLLRWARVAMGCYLIFWIISVVWLEHNANFSVYTDPVGDLLATAAAGILLVVRMRRSSETWYRDPVILAAFAILFEFAPNTALSPISAQIQSTHPTLNYVLWEIHGAFLLIAYTLDSLALRWTRAAAT